MILSIFYCTNSRGQLVEKVNVKVISNCHLENITLQYPKNAKSQPMTDSSPTRFEIHFQDLSRLSLNPHVAPSVYNIFRSALFELFNLTKSSRQKPNGSISATRV